MTTIVSLYNWVQGEIRRCGDEAEVLRRMKTSSPIVGEADFLRLAMAGKYAGAVEALTAVRDKLQELQRTEEGY